HILASSDPKAQPPRVAPGTPIRSVIQYARLAHCSLIPPGEPALWHPCIPDRTTCPVDQTTQIVNRVLPILFLIGLGAWIRWRDFLPERTVDDLRKIAANFALPSVLFLSFLNTDLQTKYITIFVALFVLCVALLMLGRAIQRARNVEHVYFPFLMTGFEYGML